MSPTPSGATIPTSEKAIYIDEYDENVLIELTDSENILIGEKSFHYQAKAE